MHALALPGGARAGDILAPINSQAYENCVAGWRCAEDAAGADFFECCDCIEKTIKVFGNLPDIDIPCEKLRRNRRMQVAMQARAAP